MHLFFLALPDLANQKSSIKLSQKYPAEFHAMLNIKRAADKILNEVGGSPVFPSNTILAGFRNPPKQDNLYAIRDLIYDIIDEAIDLIKLFSGFNTPELVCDTQLTCLTPSNNFYPVYPGKFSQNLKEITTKNSTAKRAF